MQVAEKPKPEPKKLSAIVKKLWQVLKVNKLLLASAIVTMVSLLFHASQKGPYKWHQEAVFVHISLTKMLLRAFARNAPYP